MLPAGTGNRSNEANNLELTYSLGLGGGSSQAVTSWLKPVRAWEPSQKGLLADCSQRQSEITVRPASPKGGAGGVQNLEIAFDADGPVAENGDFSGHDRDGSTEVGVGNRPDVRHKSGYRRDSSAKQLESERISYVRQETPLWGSLVSCGRLVIGPTRGVPRAFARESGGRQPPRRLPACPTSREQCHVFCGR